MPLERDFKGVSVAWSMDFGGLPVDPDVTTAIEAKRGVFEDLGMTVKPGQPDFSEADEVFKTLRAWSFIQGYGDLLETHRDQIKDTVIWNLEAGFALTGPQIARAEVDRTTLYHRVRRFMEHHDFMIFPVSQVPPFDVNTPYPTEIDGVQMETYIDWMKSCYYVTVTGLPAISVPCGFTSSGLPVGLQIVGRHEDELGVLQLAHAFEQATGTWKRRPERVAADAWPGHEHVGARGRGPGPALPDPLTRRAHPCLPGRKSSSAARAWPVCPPRIISSFAAACGTSCSSTKDRHFP